MQDVEIQTLIAERMIRLEVTKRDARVQELQDLLDRARALIEARAVELKDIPGGETGLLCRDLKGRNADQPVYKADVSLMAEIRGVMRQAAEELGQWVEKREETGTFSIIVEKLNAGRQRAARAAAERRAEKEAAANR